MKKQPLAGLACLLAFGPLLLAGCTTLTTPDGATAPASAMSTPPSPGPSALRVPGLEWPVGPDFVITRLKLQDALVARPGTDSWSNTTPRTLHKTAGSLSRLP